MTNPEEHADYRVRRPHAKTESAGVQAGNAAIVDVLQLLARAARQFHTYPPTSPLCTNAINACHQAFMSLDLDGPLSFRVSPRELILGEESVGRGTVVEQELSRPLHRARIASLEIDRAVSPRDWSRFCALLAEGAGRSQSSVSFAELLLDAGVSALVPRTTPRPEVIDVEAPPQAVQSLVERERARQASAGAGAPAQHLYPPDKGWVRLDPTFAYDSISLLDLTVLVNDPAELATMLARLIDDDAADDRTHSGALEQRYGDVVMLIGALDPRLGRILYSKLAHAVLALDADRRRALLQRAILPSLLDGHVDAEAVLAEFPDVDLADALCLLLDLEAAAPQLLPLALDRLRLPQARRTSVVPLVEAKLDAGSPAARAVDRWAAAGFDRQADALTHVEAGAAKDFAEFAAFDLSINQQTAGALTHVRDAIAATEPLDAQLACVLSLVRIEPNPTVVGAILARALPGLRTCATNQRWQDVTRWIARLDEVATRVEATRPDVARAVRDALERFCDRDLVLQLAQLCGTDPGRTYAGAIVAAVGPSLVPAWLAALDAPADRVRVRALAPVLCECAPQLGRAIAGRLPALGGEAARSAVMVLGYAGSGHETVIAEQAVAGDERRGREALRALARIGSLKAAALIINVVEHGPASVRPAAEEALWRLPAAVASAKTRELLGRRDFVTRHPESAARLLERAAQGAEDNLDRVLESLTPLRFHFWSPAVARVGAKARELLQ